MLTSLSVEANADELKLTDPRLKEFQKLIDQMSPQQKADILEQSKKVLAELEKLSPAEISELKKGVIQAKEEFDFESIDASKIDTSQPVSTKRVTEFLIEVQDAN